MAEYNIPGVSHVDGAEQFIDFDSTNPAADHSQIASKVFAAIDSSPNNSDNADQNQFVHLTNAHFGTNVLNKAVLTDLTVKATTVTPKIQVDEQANHDSSENPVSAFTLADVSNLHDLLLTPSSAIHNNNSSSNTPVNPNQSEQGEDANNFQPIADNTYDNVAEPTADTPISPFSFVGQASSENVDPSIPGLQDLVDGDLTNPEVLQAAVQAKSEPNVLNNRVALDTFQVSDFNFAANHANENSAPELDNSGTMSLNSITEDTSSNAGTSVAAIIASAGGDAITDSDSGANEGIAITSVDDTNGTWQYDANADGTWVDFGSVSQTNAVLLDESAFIRFVPDANYSGTGGDISFHAWDQTSGSNGDTGVNVSSTGGNTAFSTNSETATINVTEVVDSPTLSVSNVSGDEDTGIDLNISAALNDLDGSESLSITIDGVPTDATLSNGTDLGDGSWLLNSSDLSGLQITPGENYTGSFNLNVTATATETGGDTATTGGSFTVTVNDTLDTFVGTNNNDTFTSTSGDDIFLGKKGDDTFIFNANSGDDTVSGGADIGKNSWVDTIQLNTADQAPGGPGPGSWVLTTSDSYTIDSDNNTLTFDDGDADGSITLEDGSTIDFTDIEKIEWHS